MLDQVAQLPACLEIVQLDVFIRAARSQQLAVGRQGHGFDAAGMRGVCKNRRQREVLPMVWVVGELLNADTVTSASA